ncbi:ROK family protein [bacterium]|nr:ROK family protein [bacterium]
MSPKKQEYVVGIDLGGTKIYAAVVDHKGRILGIGRKRTKAELGFETTVQRMAICVKEAAAEADVNLDEVIAVGVGSPGPLDLKRGMIIETPNLGWKDAPLKASLKALLKRPVAIDNDGNVGLLGEYAYGAGHGCRDMVGLFIGTGIGGGVIINGKLLHGFNENAGELGHMILNPEGPMCGCGTRGCLEAFASRLAIEREIRAAVAGGAAAAIFDNVEKPDAPLRSKRLSEAFAAGDAAVVAAVEKSARYVGYGVASLLNIFNPEVVVIGGGVVEAIGEPYVRLVEQTASQNVFKIALRNVRIVAAELKDDSAVLGAAMLAWQKAYK